jgi:hypothetical protein
VINEASGEEGIKITYPHSTHVIEITGGSVVSDFQSINGTNSSSTVIGTTGSNNSSTGEG